MKPVKKLYFFSIYSLVLIGEIILTEVLKLASYLTVSIFVIALYFLYKFSRLNLDDIGLSRISRRALVWSATIFGIIFTFFSAIYLLTPDVFMDSRYDQSFISTVFSMFIILPITIVLLEELAFRGILLGYLLKNFSKYWALLISSAAFGLWHIPSSLHVGIDSFLFINHPPQIAISLVIVLVTSAAGYVFSILRLKTGSLFTSVIAHWSLNALGMLFAWLAWNF